MTALKLFSMVDPTPLTSSAADLVVRDANTADLAAVAAIYAPYVETSASTFEQIAPDETEMCRRFEDLKAKGLPFLVAERKGHVVGYAYAGHYRTRWGYRYTVEDSVYVDKSCLGHGIGRLLLSALIDRAADLGFRQMIAVIGDSENAASIALHSQLGFKAIGALPATGRKFDRWIDTVLMQRPLGDGGNSPPHKVR